MPGPPDLNPDGGAEPAGVDTLRAPHALRPRVGERDEAWCVRALEAVSRTFARPIALLDPPLDEAVRVGYLLCRVADTIEDHPSLPGRTREAWLGRFVDVLEGRTPAEPFGTAWWALGGRSADDAVCLHLPIVLRRFAALSPAFREPMLVWVGEMARGMALYARRPRGDDGIAALGTMRDLERYCFFVAGTVGEMLTALFVAQLDAMPTDAGLTRNAQTTLAEQAERFGVGLQLVNVLKDVTDDLTRGVCFVPRTTLAAEGCVPRDLQDPTRTARCHAAVAPMFEAARGHLDAGLDYLLALPRHATGMRLFCALPLWMAVATLRHAEGHDGMFSPGVAVKISRSDVEALIADAAACIDDNDAIAARYHALWTDRPRGAPGS